ncbi:acyl-CoA carboxylase subunit beta [Phenylobacterium sp.]|uniref:acyl-CoA carboxylase subunit beta n=1 Tax=Phenylobacterium sp. TaxID=1871053 RepID=UPI0025D385CB|nr:carboxyl transferase domain-containing protein [Phenylobacterium sp.]MBX3484123.1 methylmalonyl-CoA carboxyltransferase [Phenylobacterium sp.]
MSWQPEIDEIERRRAIARQMGEPERVARHHADGKLTIRERIDGLIDPDSFHEIGSISGSVEYDEAGERVRYTPSQFIFGRARIDGRPVVVGGNDFTIGPRGQDPGGSEKSAYLERMAGQLGLPLVRLIDGVGGNVRTIERLGRTYIPNNPGFNTLLENLNRAPVVALGLGIVAGYNVVKLATSHYSMMVRERSFMFMAGPPVVARLGQTVTKEELGGADLQARAGNVDDVVDSEEEAFERTRRFLSYLPASVDELPPRAACDDPVTRREDWLISAIPRDRRKVYDARKVAKAHFDKDSFFEIGRQFGGSLITAFARLDGWPVAVMVSNPHIYGGGWTADTSEKAMRFVDLANLFHLPLVNLVDVPGFVIGVEAEKAGTIRAGCRAMAAVSQAQGPACTIILRKCFGVAGGAHADHAKLQYRYAWPSGDWGSMPMEGGIEAAYRADIAAAADPAARLKEIEDNLNQLRSPLRTAEHFMIEEIIDPRATREVLCEFANFAAKLRKTGPMSVGIRP